MSCNWNYVVLIQTQVFLSSHYMLNCLTFVNSAPNVTLLNVKCIQVLSHIKSCKQDWPPALFLSFLPPPIILHSQQFSNLSFTALPVNTLFFSQEHFSPLAGYFQPKLQDLPNPYLGSPFPLTNAYLKLD